MRKRIILMVTLLTVAAMAVTAKRTPAMYYVQLKDKQGCGFTTSNPLPFLSQRAIDRRTRWNIPVDSTDLPVSRIYVDSIASLGVEIYQTTRWMNGVIVYATAAQKTQIDSLGFVVSTEMIRPSTSSNLPRKAKKHLRKPQVHKELDDDQNRQVKADSLHAAGFRGRGIQIAVIDAGFPLTDELPGFDSLRARGGILGTYNVVNKDSNVYCDHEHGTMCLSTMAFNLPNEFVGTAPDADYWLFRTEVDNEEYLYETDLWIVATEMADSAGVDVITSSLGYFFTDDEDPQFTYSAMDGRHFRSSRAATMASEKGIVVCVAAGNEGSSDWHYIDTPADADSILCIGGVDISGNHSDFSSYGPTADGRTKPEVCALATYATVAQMYYQYYGNITYSSGTSFATPIAAGTIASLMSALPEVNPAAIRKAVVETASQAGNPDNTLGYGILNGWAAYKRLTEEPEPPVTGIDYIDEAGKSRAFVNNGMLFIDGYDGNYVMYSPSGCVIGSGTIHESMDISAYPQGMYILKCGEDIFKIVK